MYFRRPSRRRMRDPPEPGFPPKRSSSQPSLCLKQPLKSVQMVPRLLAQGFPREIVLVRTRTVAGFDRCPVSLLWHLATAGQLPVRAAVGLAVVGLTAVNGAAPAQALSSEGLAPPCIISQSPWLLPSYLSNSIPSPFIWQRNHGSVGRKRCNV